MKYKVERPAPMPVKLTLIVGTEELRSLMRATASAYDNPPPPVTDEIGAEEAPTYYYSLYATLRKVAKESGIIESGIVE